MEQTEVLVLGGGPAGYAAAIHATMLGKEVVLVEKEALGGTCLNRGCIPTKSLVESASVYKGVMESKLHGISVEKVELDFPEVITRKDQVVQGLVRGLTGLLKQKGVRVLKGEARYVGDLTVEVNTEEGSMSIQGKKVLISTGTVPRQIPLLKEDGILVQTSDHLLQAKTLPRSLVIIGGGVIGCEFASIFSAFGVDVTIIEMTPRLIPTEDQEISKTLQREFKKAKIKVLTDATVVGLTRNGDQASISVLQKGKESSIQAERVLVSVGRMPVLPEGLSIARTPSGYIEVDERFQTSLPNVYAAGDIIGGLQLAHLAFEEGMAAVGFAFGHTPKHTWQVPRCVYTHPEIGCVGLTEEELQGREGVQKGTYWLKGNGKATIIGENSGFCKVLALDGKVVGVHMIGPAATELVVTAALAIEQGITLSAWAEVIHAHPTVSECMKESVLLALGRGLHA